MDCKNRVVGPIPPFWGFSAFTPTIPKLYWDVKSQEQRILNLFDLLNKLICYANEMGKQIDFNTADIEQLQKDFEELKDGGLIDFYEEQLNKWINEHAGELITELTRSVYFGITTTGYFVAYVPDSWEDIIFSTGANFGTQDYGRLILSFDVDSPASEVIQDPNWLTNIQEG